MPANRQRGFTLIEILIVVMILGILASIIIGLFNNTTAEAAAGSLRDNLRAIRNAIQIYSAEHGAYPALGTFEAQLTQYSDGTGNTSVTMSSTHKYGPYILRLPALPVGVNRGKSTVTGPTYTPDDGWQYDAVTGDFRANCGPTETDGEGNYYHTF